MLGTALSFALGNWQRFVAYGVVALLVAGMLELDGYRRGERKLWEYQAEQAKQTVAVVVKQGRVTERVVTRYVQVRAAAKVVEKTVEKEVIRYAETNPGSCLDARWGWVHDHAAAGTVPDPAGEPDGAGGAPKAAEALDTVTANYAACRRTADRLDGLQAWVREQKAVR